MTPKLIEATARAIIGPYDPVPEGVDYTLEELREIRWRQAGEAGQAMALQAAKAAIAAMQPHIEAQSEDAARMALEEAARENLMICLTNCEELTDEAMEALNFAADRIRAIDPAQFRRPTDADL